MFGSEWHCVNIATWHFSLRNVSVITVRVIEESPLMAGVINYSTHLQYPCLLCNNRLFWHKGRGTGMSTVIVPEL